MTTMHSNARLSHANHTEAECLLDPWEHGAVCEPAEWEIALMEAGQPVPLEEPRTVWTVSPTTTERHTARGGHVSTVALVDDDMPMPSKSERGQIRFVANHKRRAAKQPFSRLTDGERHPVTVRSIA